MELKRVVDALRPEFSDEMAFVLADMSTPQGYAFAARYNLPQTTLVFFSASGRVVGTLSGEQSVPYLRSTFQRFLATDARS